MRYSKEADLMDLQILLNFTMQFQKYPKYRTEELHKVMRKAGYVPTDEVAHKAVLVVSKLCAQVRIRFSYIDSETGPVPVRRLGSFYVGVTRTPMGWYLEGDY